MKMALEVVVVCTWNHKCLPVTKRFPLYKYVDHTVAGSSGAQFVTWADSHVEIDTPSISGEGSMEMDDRYSGIQMF